MATLSEIFKLGKGQQTQSYPQQPQQQDISFTPTGVPIGAGVNTSLFRQLQSQGFDYETAKQAAISGIDPRVKGVTNTPVFNNVKSNVRSAQQLDSTTPNLTSSSKNKTYSNEDIANAINSIGTMFYGGTPMPQAGSAADIFALQDQMAKDRLNRTGAFAYDKQYHLSPDQLSQLDNSAEGLGKQRLQAIGQAYADSTKSSIANQSTGGELNEKQYRKFSQLSSDFDNLTKTQRSAIAAYNNIATTSKSARAGSPQAQIAMVFQFMRSLDPTSTVREGEYATAQNAAGVPDRIRNYWNALASGRFLTPTQIDGFTSEAKSIAENADRELTTYAQQQAKRAQMGGVPVDASDFYESYMYDTTGRNNNNQSVDIESLLQ